MLDISVDQGQTREPGQQRRQRRSRLAPEPTLGAERRGRRVLRLGPALSDVAVLLLTLALTGAPGRGGLSVADALLGAAVWLGSFMALRTYHRLSTLEELRRTAGATGVGFGALLAIGSFNPGLRGLAEMAGLFWILLTGLELLTRLAWRTLRRHPAVTPRLALRTIVAGAKDEVERALLPLRNGDSGLQTVGTVALSAHSPNGKDRLAPLVEAIRAKRAECVVVAAPSLPSEQIARIVRAARLEGAKVRLTANLPDVLPDRIHVETHGPISLVSLSIPRLTGRQVFLKRLLDVFLASLALLAGAPLMLGIALAISWTSPGPALFLQERVTLGGRVFRMLKFRTMRLDADHLLADVDPTAPFFKLRDDPRLTPVGRFLRRTSLDELPQLFNVIKGDMSLVGPRPLPAEQVAANPELLGPRHEVLAGITGWWQVKGRSDLNPEEAVRLDTFYIENWSLGLDIAILLRTFGAVLRRVGAY